jgi:hypothetical protein
MESTLLLLLGLGLLLVLVNGDWKLALFYTFFVGFVQDPLRKMTPGQPQYLLGLVVVSAAITLITLLSSRRKIPFKLAFQKDTALLQYFPIFVWLILISALNGFLRSGAVEVPILGLLVYSSPLMAIWLGFHFSTNPGSVFKLLYFYVALVCIFAFTILLSFWGVSSPLFKEVGEGNIIFLDIGVGITGHSGLWRTSEIAAWHLGAASCFAITLGARTKKFLPILGSLVLTLFLMWISILTGRRKVLTLVAGFLVVFTILLIANTRRLTRNTFLSALGLIGFSAAIFVLSGGLNELQSGVYGSFFRRGSSVFGDVAERFQGYGVGGSFAALEDSGLFGYGVGTIYQESISRFGIDVVKSKIGWASEGGIGKLAYDVGIVGVVFLAIIFFLLARLFIRLLRDRQLNAMPDYVVMVGMFSFLIANLPTFAAAGQVFNDFYILLILGLSSGFILGLGVLNTANVNGLEPYSNPTHESSVY